MENQNKRKSKILYLTRLEEIKEEYDNYQKLHYKQEMNKQRINYDVKVKLSLAEVYHCYK